jgi:hypothetical protein
MHDGTGVGWDETSPKNTDAAFPYGAQEIRDLRKGVRIRSDKEHVAAGVASAGGEHKEGSAKGYYEAAAPTNRPDGTTALVTADAGRLWIDSADNLLNIYSGSAWVMARAGLQVAYLSDNKSHSTNGGSSSATTWHKRTLTEITDVSGLVSVASSQFTPVAGTFLIFASAPAYYVDTHQLRLRNATAGTTSLLGSTEHAGDTDTVQTRSTLVGIFTANGSDAYELQHYTEQAKTDSGLGRGDHNTGEGNVFAQIVLVRIS